MNAVSKWSLVVAPALALAAIVAWPAYLKQSESAARAAALPTPAPVSADYLQRDKTIAFWERFSRLHIAHDSLSPRNLAEQYLQRYRERGDIDDVLRAKAAAETSLREQPRNNMAGEMQLAAVDLTLHRFLAALALTRHVESYDAGDPAMLTREASLDLEIGAYDTARARLDSVSVAKRDDGWRIAQARDLELTGHLADARELLATVSAYQNAVLDTPAQSRAWYFFRQGEMAFEAGDNDGAIAFERRALDIFPHFADAFRAAARVECALKRWDDCRRDATASADIVPYPETLGYEADAQEALGDAAGAAQTRDLIVTIERIGNAQHVSDRLLAIYYSEHRIRTADAYAIAKRELKIRNDIFTEDTLAWAAAMDGRWDEARAAIRKATRLNTENSLLDYHAAVIALHFGDRDAAKRSFQAALALNANFHARYADDARAELAKL